MSAVALAWHLVGGRLPRPELPFLEPLGRLVPWIPRLLGIHLGVSLLSLAVQNAYLAPNLSLDDVAGGAAIAFAEGLLGVWFITGAWLRPAGLVTLLLGPLAALLAGPVAMLEAIDLLGIALFLVVLPPAATAWAPWRRRPRSRPWPSSPCVSAPGSPWWCWRSARSSPTRPWPASSSRTELIGHLPVSGAMLALLVYGSDRGTADLVPAWPRPSSLRWTSARRRDSTGLSTRPS